MNEIILGYGSVILSTMSDEKGFGIGFLSTGEVHEIDSYPEKYALDYTLKETDTIIWIDNIKSAEVLLRQLNYTIFCMKEKIRRENSY